MSREWYLAVVLHYMGSEAWAVGFLKRGIGPSGLKSSWEWVEGLTWEQATSLMEREKSRVKLTSSKSLLEALSDASA